MNTNIHLWQYLAQLFLEWETFQRKVVEKIKTHVLWSVTLSRKSRRLWDNVEKYGRDRQYTHDSTKRRMRFVPWITKATDTHLVLSYRNNVYVNDSQIYVGMCTAYRVILFPTYGRTGVGRSGYSKSN